MRRRRAGRLRPQVLRRPRRPTRRGFEDDSEPEDFDEIDALMGGSADDKGQSQ